ncbi:SusC/RagA family TonB-linked outer membrane protein [Flavivirga rizhaonensis]|uniref:SusC/RagA family TonB-linked outer membrane protein n=1 Tax=Flavivirga rizhaonensis TaxID=2559571 RepID=A0A4S1DWZ3_9FLAO|nr:SusC/RagA family TonB-linked outer membrane protein [Flavivirga rizhaonensis]TGV02048.1 SusC/RagA family TonB-linked outer membrane protein [Flavivirga rizhaonensis]
MKTKFSGILTLLLAFVVQLTFAQEKTISGTVSDDSGLPLPGATVLVKGTSSGTSSDFDGKYSIRASERATLVFSFVGYTTQEVSVGASNTVNVTLQEDATALEEVVVTALGIKRKPKELAYATAVIEQETLIQAAPVDATSALVGKVSGLNINFSDNGVRPNSTVRLRASTSINGNNDALIVIDGVPQSSSALSDLNPNDIESVNTLKGASSATLYGSAGANGALIITTKKGKNNGKITVSINSAVTFEVLKFFPETQSEFGSGSSNNFNYTPDENESWGPRYDGTIRQIGPVLLDGTFQTGKYAPVKNGRENFFETGIGTQNSISISGGDDTSTYFFSAQRVDKTGITPGDKYFRDNFRFNATKKYGKFETGTIVSFFQDKVDQAGPSPNDGSFYRILLNTPAHIDLQKYKNWRTDQFATPDTYFNAFFKNPYQVIEQNRDTNRRNRLQAVANFKYTFNDWLSATYSLGGTWSNRETKNTQEAFTYIPNTPYPRPSDEVNAVADGTSSDFRLNSDLLFNIDKQLSDDFNLRVIIGTHLESRRNNQMNIIGNNLFTNEIFNVNVRQGNLAFNTTNFASPQSTFQKRLYSYLGDVTLGFKDYLFLTGSWRQDTSSTLPVQNNTYQYYSGGLSFIATDAIQGLKGDVLDFLKFNVSYAKVGKDAGIQSTNENLIVPVGFPFTNPGLRPTTIAVDPNLSPEFTTSIEAGFRAEFLRKRITLDANYYVANSEDQISNAAASRASGASSFLTNVGEIQNKGIEIDLNLIPLQTENFQWDLGLTFATNDSEVISLSDGADRIQIGTAISDTAGIFAVVGDQYPSLFAPAYVRDPQGRIVVGADGNPSPTSEFENLGNTVPNVIAGITTRLSYKGLSLRAVADYKTGHVFYSTVVEALEFAGLTKNSVSTNRQPFIFPNSVYETAPGSGVFVENTDRPTSDGTRNFWQTSYNEIKENYVVDASAIKLREIALDYTLPRKTLEKTPFETITFGIVANNLIMWRAAENIYTDPEFSLNSGFGQNTGIGANNNTTVTNGTTGIGTSAQAPPSGTYGFKVNVKF